MDLPQCIFLQAHSLVASRWHMWDSNLIYLLSKSGGITYPFKVIVLFDSLTTKWLNGPVRLMSAYAHRHIRCHEIRYWPNWRGVLKGFCNDREINLLRRRRYLRLACTVIYVRTCLWCLVYICNGRRVEIYDFKYDCSGIVGDYRLYTMCLPCIR